MSFVDSGFDPNVNYTGGSPTNLANIASGQGYNMTGLPGNDISGSSSSGLGSSIGNIAGPALAGGFGLYDIFKGDPSSAPVNALTAEAGQLGTEGTQLTQQGQGLQSYLEQGTLPPAQQAQLELAQNAAKARLIQGAASRGQNTSPTGNSGLTQDLNSLGLQTEAERGALEKQLFDAGTSLISEGNTALGMETGIQEKLAAIDAQQQQDTTNAIMGFAKSLGSMDWSKIGSSLATIGTLAL
jgi:hypothetical protein